MLTELYLDRTSDIDRIFNSKIYHKIDKILLQSSQISSFQDKNKKLAVLIDYPYGLSNTSVREHEIIYSIRSGVKYIDLPINPDFIKEEKLSLLFDDFFSCNKICKEKNVILRPILEYRLFSTDYVLDIIERLNSNNVENIILGTGSIVDDISDNIIFCAEILKKTLMNPIPTVNNLSLSNLQTLSSIGVKTIRFTSISILEKIMTTV